MKGIWIMIDRRTFLKSAAAAAGTIILNPLHARQLRAAKPQPNPGDVFP
jgi:hypothetical protein